MIILGIDGGLAHTGWAAVRVDAAGEVLEALGVVATEKSDRRRHVLAADDTMRRARELHRALAAALEQHRPAVVAIEAQSSPRNASSAGKLAMSLGVVASLVEARGLPLVAASPQEVKRAATGRKDAGKAAIEDAMRARFGNAGELLERIRRSDREHAADALAVVVACLDAEAVRLARRLAA